MTEIKFRGSTYRGTAEGALGVFTDNNNGTVYAGSIAYGSACIGVATATDGTTTFVECDADGKEHGRVLDCYANGDTWYGLCEHGSDKEHARLCANGTCLYNGKVCRVDLAPFLALQEKVLPIKARPPLVPQQPPFFMPHFFRPHRPPIGPIGHVLALAGAGDNPRRQGARPPPPPSACVGLVAQQLPHKCTVRPTWTTQRRKGAPRVRRAA
jgi:hypothetical protein